MTAVYDIRNTKNSSRRRRGGRSSLLAIAVVTGLSTFYRFIFSISRHVCRKETKELLFQSVFFQKPQKCYVSRKVICVKIIFWNLQLLRLALFTQN